MKLPLKQIVKNLKTEASVDLRELKRNVQPLKMPFEILKLVVGYVVGILAIAPLVPIAASVFYAILMIVLIMIPFILIACRNGLIHVFKSDKSDWVAEANRLILLLFSTTASLCFFLWAIFDHVNSALYFPAAALVLLALWTAKARLTIQKTQGAIVPFLVKNLTGLLLIFTIVSGLYSIPALLLRQGIEGGLITLRQLNWFDTFVHVSGIQLGRLHFSAAPAFALAGLFIFLGCVERNWTRHRSPHRKFPWRIVRPGMKWMIRTATVALFAAIFLSLAVHQYGSYVATGLHEFKDLYSRLQNIVERPVERAIQRELIARSWAQLNDSGRETIRNSVRNRKAFEKLEQEYAALAALGFANAQTEKVISQMQVPTFSQESPVRPDALAEERLNLPDDLGHVSLQALSIALHVNSDPESSAVSDSADEVNEMALAVKSSTIGFVAGNASDQARLYAWLNKHFSGLSEILDSIQDAGGESLTQAMKQARARVIAEKLAAPKSDLAVLVARDGRSVAAQIPLHSIQLSDDFSSISAERATIQRAESFLRRQAPKAIKVASEMSKARTEHMVNQLTIMDRRFPFLNLSAGGFIQQHPDYSQYMGYWAITALQTSESDDAQLRMLENLKTIADANSVTELSRQFRSEQYYRNLLAELVGQEDDELPGIRDILGPDFDAYEKLYEARLQTRMSGLSEADD
jgi:hypothetical protein